MNKFSKNGKKAELKVTEADKMEIVLVQMKNGVTIASTGTATVAIHLDASGKMGVLAIASRERSEGKPFAASIVMLEEEKGVGWQSHQNLDAISLNHPELFALFDMWELHGRDFEGVEAPEWPTRS